MKRLTPLVLAAGLNVCALPAAAQETITLTTSGNLLFLNDGLGLFGDPGSRREDGAFSLSITLEADPLLKTMQPGYVYLRPADNGTGRASGIATIEGQTWRWGVDSINVQAGLNRAANSAWMSASGIDAASGFDVYAREVLEPQRGSPQFIGSDNYREEVVFGGVRNQVEENGAWLPPAYFSVTGMLACASCPGGSMQGSTVFVSDEPVFARWTVSAVPEPSTWMLLIGGIGLLAGVRRGRPLLGSARSISFS